MHTRRAQRHLLAAWNPSFQSNAVELHLSVLLNEVDEFRKGRCDEDDVYVWWAKMRSPSRSHRLPHIKEILAVDEECDRDRHPEREVHLYVTDYQSLYVAHLGEVTADDVREMGDERAHIPEYYFTSRREVDCWFRLFDIRRLVADEPHSVIEELERLKNVRHFSRPVSIYGGMVDLPLIVTRPDGAQFFDDRERESLADGKFWVEFDAERVGVGVMERELRENMFGDRVWRLLKPTARSFLATAEKIFRDHRSDPVFDFTPVIVEFAKVFEVQCNAILREALGHLPDAYRKVNIDGESVDVATHGALSLTALARVIGDVPEIRSVLRKLRHGSWLTAELPGVLRRLACARNPAAHMGRVGWEEARRWREEIVGIGHPGYISCLAEIGRDSV